jgi:hypothetical protein
MRLPWTYSLSPGKGAVLASAALASFVGSPASGLLRRPAATARKSSLADEAPWPLCALCGESLHSLKAAPEGLRMATRVRLSAEPAGETSEASQHRNNGACSVARVICFREILHQRQSAAGPLRRVCDALGSDHPGDHPAALSKR